METIHLYAYVEDMLSKATVNKMVVHVNRISTVRVAFRPGFPSVENGSGRIKKKVPGLIKMAKMGIPSLVVTDLDTVSCAPSLIRSWAKLPERPALTLPPGLTFRVAVREIESWIMADRDAFAAYMSIAKSNFAKAPDTLPDPKQRLLNVIRKKGRKKWHKEMLPMGLTASIGPRYNEKLCEFVNNEWEPVRAKENSPSLARAIRALSNVRLQ